MTTMGMLRRWLKSGGVSVQNAEFKPSPGFIQHILKLAIVDRACEQVAEAGVAYAKSIARVGSAPKDPHPGAYRDGIHAERREEKNRVEWRIVASDKKSHWIEFGAEHNAKDRTLGRTEDHLRGHNVG
jgi:hypothetical protein